MKEKIDYCSEHQVARMFDRFYPDEPEHRGAEFARLVASLQRNVSAAQIQGYFMFYKTDAQGAISNAENIWTI